MSYATNLEVIGEFKSLTYVADTANGVTSAEVDAWLDQDSAMIDSCISSKYTVPVTSATESEKVLKKICLLMTVARVRVRVKDTVPNRESSDNETKLAFKLLEQIRKGELDLTDATSGNSNANVFRSYNQVNSITPIHKKETEQW